MNAKEKLAIKAAYQTYKAVKNAQYTGPNAYNPSPVNSVGVADKAKDLLKMRSPNEALITFTPPEGNDSQKARGGKLIVECKNDSCANGTVNALGPNTQKALKAMGVGSVVVSSGNITHVLDVATGNWT